MDCGRSYDDHSSVPLYLSELLRFQQSFYVLFRVEKAYLQKNQDYLIIGMGSGPDWSELSTLYSDCLFETLTTPTCVLANVHPQWTLRGRCVRAERTEVRASFVVNVFRMLLQYPRVWESSATDVAQVFRICTLQFLVRIELPFNNIAFSLCVMYHLK